MRNAIPHRYGVTQREAQGMIAASQGPAKFILATTIEIADADAPVLCRHADRAAVIGSVLIQQDETYYLVESAKFAQRYYVVVERGGWQCSSREEAIAQACIAKVQAFVSASYSTQPKAQAIDLEAQLRAAQAAFWLAESKVSRARTEQSRVAWTANREAARAEHHRLLAVYAAAKAA